MIAGGLNGAIVQRKAACLVILILEAVEGVVINIEFVEMIVHGKDGECVKMKVNALQEKFRGKNVEIVEKGKEYVMTIVFGMNGKSVLMKDVMKVIFKQNAVEIAAQEKEYVLMVADGHNGENALMKVNVLQVI
jgi:hypothetical protein